ncbi:hypothetical protein [Bradyrhizobium sp. BR 10289]|uniref:hypothetical protein n=1 Tax=Bradyrhizobium sp. BR 10289 TaxID=2749993 RepID=UPI001C64A1D1|nr:hypothetical protein [Bradyrhizobium sp. BR 10289]MBW7973751.1 hypothetical protein [Bradyrhizobium sp. BR 10289]
MATHDHFSTGLSLFEIPQWLVEPAVRSCRLFNTALDFIFYDVLTLRAGLAGKDAQMAARDEKLPSRIVDFDALSNPEGSMLLIDAATPPYVHEYKSVEAFLNSPYQETRDVDIVTITGVGSSALGSAALAWDVSVALRKPVLALVPGYGVADVLLQSLGGWFAFGLHDYLGSKSMIQKSLAATVPEVASIGRKLAASAPSEPTLRGAPVFRTGSGSSDVLHALLMNRKQPFRMLVGHSKGALQISNAIRSVPAERLDGIRVVTLGCPIGEDLPNVAYHQYLGLFDALGQLNAWGHKAEHWPPTWHSTNPVLPPAMAAGKFASESVTGCARPAPLMSLMSS